MDRIEARERVEQALELERSLMNGARPTQRRSSWRAGSRTACASMLRDAALGELGADLGTAADETLIAAGLEAGDAEIAVGTTSRAGRYPTRSGGMVEIIVARPTTIARSPRSR